MKVSLRQLEAFLLVAEEASVSRAAERMGLTQSAVSVLIRELERSIGDISLLERSPRAVRLTAAGREALPRAQLIVSETGLLVRDLKGLSELRRGRVKIAATVALASSLLPRLIKEFQSRYPAIVVEIFDVDPGEFAEVVRRGQVDIGLATTEIGDHDLEVEPIVSDKISMIVPSSSPHAKRRSITWSELRELKTITVRRENTIRTMIERSLGVHGQQFSPDIEVLHLATALALTAEGFGSAVLPSYLVPYMGIGSFVAIPLRKPEIVRDIALVRRRGHRPTPATLAFRKFASEAIKRRE